MAVVLICFCLYSNGFWQRCLFRTRVLVRSTRGLCGTRQAQNEACLSVPCADGAL